MKKQSKSIQVLSNLEVLKQIKKTTHHNPNQKEAEKATEFYLKELFDFDISQISNFEIDLSEFAGEI